MGWRIEQQYKQYRYFKVSLNAIDKIIMAIQSLNWDESGLGVRVQKLSAWASGPLFFKYFWQFRGKQWPRPLFAAFRSLLLWGYTIAIITPMPRPAHVVQSGPRARLHVLQNSGRQMFMLRNKTLSAQDHHWRNPGRKKLKRVQQDKSTHLSALTGSMQRKMADGLQRFDTPQDSNPCYLTHYNLPQPMSHELEFI